MGVHGPVEKCANDVLKKFFRTIWTVTIVLEEDQSARCYGQFHERQDTAALKTQSCSFLRQAVPGTTQVEELVGKAERSHRKSFLFPQCWAIPRKACRRCQLPWTAVCMFYFLNKFYFLESLLHQPKHRRALFPKVSCRNAEFQG